MSIWNSSPQRELATNPLSGKLGADHESREDPDNRNLGLPHGFLASPGDLGFELGALRADLGMGGAHGRLGRHAE
jgi:hypothetical protein